MARLSVIIITCNEEANICRCLKSVEWADEIIVADSRSTDKTAELVRKHGGKLFEIDWPGFGPAKQAALERATGDWVLSIDADEELSPELAGEIKTITQDSSGSYGYYMPRKANFLGRWIYHCGWYPDPVLRLFRRDKGRFDRAVVHEQVLVEGPIGRLSGELLHYSYPDLETYFAKFNRYTTIGAEELARKGVRSSFAAIVFRPAVSFIKHYISKRGFLDGIEGLLISVFSSMAVMVKYAKLRQINRASESAANRKL